MGAMPEEINDLVACLTLNSTQVIGQRTYYEGILWGKPVVIVFSRWGKVAAATTVSTLILKFKVDQVIFTGVAGAIHDDLTIGDIVIAKQLYQHDMDARPLMAQFEIPLLNKTYFETPEQHISQAANAAKEFLETILTSISALAAFNIVNPKIHIGNIASGDKFFASHEEKLALQKALPHVLCVEMEGAAVAQVCYEFDIPCTIIRTISDSANNEAHIDFPKFINEISSKYSMGILKALLNTLTTL